VLQPADRIARTAHFTLLRHSRASSGTFGPLGALFVPMPEAKPARIVVRFPRYASRSWRERCLASLAAAGHVDVTPVSGPTLSDPVDLILDLSGETFDPSQLALTRLGYWTFIYGDEPERIAPGLQEYVAGGRAAYARLVRLDNPDRGTVKYKKTKNVRTITKTK